MEDKISTREILRNLSVSPYFARFKNEDSLEDFIDKQKGLFPLIAKTPVSTGSKDVLFIKDEKQLAHSIKKLLEKGSDEVLLEEYLEGPQYLIEACVFNGEVHVIAVLEQEITFFERFIVTGYCLLGEMDITFYNKIHKTVCLIGN